MKSNSIEVRKRVIPELPVKYALYGLDLNGMEFALLYDTKGELGNQLIKLWEQLEDLGEGDEG